MAILSSWASMYLTSDLTNNRDYDILSYIKTNLVDKFALTGRSGSMKNITSRFFIQLAGAAQ